MAKRRGSARDSRSKSADIQETAQSEDEKSSIKTTATSSAPPTRMRLRASGSKLATKANVPESEGNKPTANSGPWTAEEHKLFLQGYKKYKDYKNRWQSIAREFVHTRTSKQVGIHGYFCADLNEGTGDEKVAKGKSVEVAEKLGKEQKILCEQKQNDGNVSKLAAKKYGSTLLEPDACADSDGEAGGEGRSESKNSDACDGDDGDDGNCNQCIICNNTGVLYCCSKCPRAFHAKCLAKDGCYVDVKALPPQWICHRCEWDREISSDETDEMSLFSMNRKIKAAYIKFNDHDCPNFTYCAMLLGLMAQIINKLKSYDYGYIFSDPVDPNDAPNYHDIIKTPMDYSTIMSKLEDGGYAEFAAMRNTNERNDSVDNEVDSQTAMERILCGVIRDINQVFHNCLVFNSESTSFYRAAEVHIRKWEAYLNHFVIHRLPQNDRRFIETINLSEPSMQSKEIKPTPNAVKELEDIKTVVKSDKKTIENSANEIATGAETAEMDVREVAEDAIEVKLDESIKSKHGQINSFSERPDTNSTPDDISAAPLLQSRPWTDQEHAKFIEGHNKYGNRRAKISEEFVPTRTARQIGSRAQFRGQWKGGAQASETKSIVSTTKRDGSQPDEMKTDIKAIADDPDITYPPLKRRKKTKKLSDDSPLSRINQQEKKNSPVLLLTREQIMAFEHVFFTPIDDLRRVVMPDNFDDYVNTCLLDSAESGDVAVEDEASSQTQTLGRQPKDEADKTSSKSHLNSMKITPEEVSSAPKLLEKTDKRGEMVLKQWYERLRDLRNHKIMHGNALVSSSVDMKLYSWCHRQRKRYHLTLHRIPEFRSDRILQQHGAKTETQKAEKTWLTTVPNMTGDFALTPLSKSGDIETINTSEGSKPAHSTATGFSYTTGDLRSITISDADIWHDCLEELRFFHGDTHHTIVPSDFHHNRLLPVWVQTNRAKFLLQLCGLYSGFTFGQLFVLDELKISKFDDYSFHDIYKALRQNDEFNDSVDYSVNSEMSATSFSGYLRDFTNWYRSSNCRSPTSLGSTNPSLFSWCRKICHEVASILCGAPTPIATTNEAKLNPENIRRLSVSKFFCVFPYDEAALACEDDYIGSGDWITSYKALEKFSIKFGTTKVPPNAEVDCDLSAWTNEMHRTLSNFAKGDLCELSFQQIEKLILIGFCTDRADLPNLSRSDVIWLKRFFELRRYKDLFGDCHVTSDFPGLVEWIQQQKKLFKMKLGGEHDFMKNSRFNLLIRSGVDLYIENFSSSPIIVENLNNIETWLSSPNILEFPETTRASGDEYERKSLAHFASVKKKLGHCLVLPYDDEEVYWWIVHKRWQSIQRQANNGIRKQQSFHVFSYITGNDLSSDEGINQSSLLWSCYCERLMLFEARMGHTDIPINYVDKPLFLWLRKQQHAMHLFSMNKPSGISSIQLKLLLALGVRGSELKLMPPRLSSRVLSASVSQTNIF